MYFVYFYDGGWVTFGNLMSCKVNPLIKFGIEVERCGYVELTWRSWLLEQVDNTRSNSTSWASLPGVRLCQTLNDLSINHSSVRNHFHLIHFIFPAESFELKLLDGYVSSLGSKWSFLFLNSCSFIGIDRDASGVYWCMSWFRTTVLQITKLICTIWLKINWLKIKNQRKKSLSSLTTCSLLKTLHFRNEVTEFSRIFRYYTTVV